MQEEKKNKKKIAAVIALSAYIQDTEVKRGLPWTKQPSAGWFTNKNTPI